MISVRDFINRNDYYRRMKCWESKMRLVTLLELKKENEKWRTEIKSYGEA
jgi:hypothetical protein